MSEFVKFLFSTLKIGFVGFGGGNALIPVIHKTVVEDKKIIDEDVFENNVVVANVTPGALPVEIAGGIGKELAGTKGLILASFAMALPGVFFTLLFLCIISSLSEGVLLQIEFMTIGVTAFISCLLTDYLAKTIKKEKKYSAKINAAAIILMVFLLTCGKHIIKIFGYSGRAFFGLSAVSVFAMAFFVVFYTGGKFDLIKSVVSIAVCGVFILFTGKNTFFENNCIKYVTEGIMFFLSVYGLVQNKALKGLKKAKIWKICLMDFGVLLALTTIVVLIGISVVPNNFSFAIKAVLSSIMSFGGGDAYLSVADGLFVNSGMIEDSEFYRCIVPIVNVLPGSILCKTLSGIGFYIGYNETSSIVGGLIIAITGFVCSVCASCAVVSLGKCVYENIGNLSILEVIKKVIRPIVSGLLMSVVLSFVSQNIQIGKTSDVGLLPVIFMAIIYVIDLGLLYKKKMNMGFIALISAILSLLMCNAF